MVLKLSPWEKHFGKVEFLWEGNLDFHDEENEVCVFGSIRLLRP